MEPVTFEVASRCQCHCLLLTWQASLQRSYNVVKPFPVERCELLSVPLFVNHLKSLQRSCNVVKPFPVEPGTFRLAIVVSAVGCFYGNTAIFKENYNAAYNGKQQDYRPRLLAKTFNGKKSYGLSVVNLISIIPD